MRDLIPSPGTPEFLMLCLAGYLLLANVLAYAALAADRRRVRAGQEGLPQRTLLVLAAVGGWPGAKLAQWRLRHRPGRWPFRLALNLIAAGQVAAVVLLTTPLGGQAADRIAGLTRQMQDLGTRLMPPAQEVATAEAVASGDTTAVPEATEEKVLPRRFGPGSDDW
jgi:uncharacterized membrane protein YsdA (DUF1294 family)